MSGQRLSDEAYDRLRELLGSGGFPRDARLPAEATQRIQQAHRLTFPTA
jgi:DNA-binding FadR family transcriptional regulator